MDPKEFESWLVERIKQLEQDYESIDDKDTPPAYMLLGAIDELQELLEDIASDQEDQED